MHSIRDRIVEFRRVPAAELRPHPDNWRKHPDVQRQALAGVLDTIGYADALIARRLPDGALQLIDGHLRAATTPDVEVPVLVVDLDEREAALLLAVHDPLAGMAETDEAKLRTILASVETKQVDLAAILRDVVAGDVFNDAVTALPEPTWNEVYQVVVECGDEQKQRAVFERLTAEGHCCRVLTL